MRKRTTPTNPDTLKVSRENAELKLRNFVSDGENLYKALKHQFNDEHLAQRKKWAKDVSFYFERAFSTDREKTEFLHAGLNLNMRVRPMISGGTHRGFYINHDIEEQNNQIKCLNKQIEVLNRILSNLDLYTNPGEKAPIVSDPPSQITNHFSGNFYGSPINNNNTIGLSLNDCTDAFKRLGMPADAIDEFIQVSSLPNLQQKEEKAKQWFEKILISVGGWVKDVSVPIAATMLTTIASQHLGIPLNLPQ